MHKADSQVRLSEGPSSKEIGDGTNVDEVVLMSKGEKDREKMGSVGLEEREVKVEMKKRV